MWKQRMSMEPLGPETVFQSVKLPWLPGLSLIICISNFTLKKCLAFFHAAVEYTSGFQGSRQSLEEIDRNAK